MKKNKGKVNTTEKEFVFGFRAGRNDCVLKVPLQFPVQENVSDLHGRLMLLHKIPCFVENGNEISNKLNVIKFKTKHIDIFNNLVSFIHPHIPFGTTTLMYLGLELRSTLSMFIESETIQDYDREAELALQRLTTGEVDINQLTNTWAKTYSEVKSLIKTKDHVTSIFSYKLSP